MKKLIVFALCILCSLSLFSCKNDKADSTDTSDTQGAQSSSGTQVIYDNDYIKEHLPDSYTITYNVTEKDESITCSVTKTNEGVLIDIGDGDPILFIRNEEKEGYDMYSKGSESSYTKMDMGGVVITDAIVNQSLVSFSGWFTAYQSRSEQLVADGTGNVADHECYKYKYIESEDSYAMYYTDIKTGVCLKYEPFNIKDEEFNYTFECTEFKTENISLPEYKD